MDPSVPLLMTMVRSGVPEAGAIAPLALLLLLVPSVVVGWPGVTAESGTDVGDGDGVGPVVERLVGTDPGDPDTDDDGIPDGVELEREGANPLQRDVFVEVDRTAGTDGWLPDDQRTRLVEAFASAPIPNPNGQSGVRLHIVEDDVIETTANGSDAATFRRFERSNRDAGPYAVYAVLVGDLAGKQTRGQAYGWLGGFAVDANRTSPPSRYEPGSVFMHELGHVLGLRPDAFVGIDARTHYFDEYASVMNYDSPTDYYDYSREAPFDGWASLGARPFPVGPTGNGSVTSDDGR